MYVARFDWNSTRIKATKRKQMKIRSKWSLHPNHRSENVFNFRYDSDSLILPFFAAGCFSRSWFKEMENSKYFDFLQSLCAVVNFTGISYKLKCVSHVRSCCVQCSFATFFALLVSLIPNPKIWRKTFDFTQSWMWISCAVTLSHGSTLNDFHVCSK